jgi:ADP-heptose:LPS heptosyltransferase
LLTFSKLKYIHHSNNNIYESYQFFFESKLNIIDTQKHENKFSVVIFPDSRKKEKKIDQNIIDKISNACNHKIKIASFGKNKMQSESSMIAYENFIQLIQIIKDADFIISSDSLPAHLANYLNKPHWVIYNNKINNEWLTPFCVSNNTFCLSTNIEQLTETLKNRLC